MTPLRALVVVLLTVLLGTVAIAASVVNPGGPYFFNIARHWSRLVLWLSRVRLSVHGTAGAPRRGPAIYMSNHQSLLDVPALVLAIPRDCRFIAKRELGHIPIFGWALRAAGFVFIDRDNRQRAIESLERAAGLLTRGDAVLVFAEGTRSPDGRLLPFKKGGFVLAIKAGAPIIPVAVQGGANLLPKGSVRGRPGHISVTIGAPIDTTTFTLENKEALIESVRTRIAALLA